MRSTENRRSGITKLTKGTATKSTGKRLGLLVNFGHYPKAEFERLVN